MEDCDKLKEALEAYQSYNRLRNDLDAYLYNLAEWAMGGEVTEKPTPKEFGL